MIKNLNRLLNLILPPEYFAVETSAFRNEADRAKDIRNEPDYEKMQRPGSAGEKRKGNFKPIPAVTAHSDTELDKEDLVLAPL